MLQKNPEKRISIDEALKILTNVEDRTQTAYKPIPIQTSLQVWIISYFWLS